MKKLIIMLLLAAPTTVFAQKFGHINAQQVMQDMTEFVAADGEIKVKAKEFENEFTEMQQEFQKKLEAYEKAAPTMNETKKQEEEQALMEMQQKLQLAEKDYQSRIQAFYQEKMAPVQDKLMKAIQTVAKNGGFVYIMDVLSGPLYINEDLSTDITALVKAELKK